jgi:hypothetical protein
MTCEPLESPGPQERVPPLVWGVAICGVLVAAFFLCLHPIAVTDFWWQAKTGELIVRQGIPRSDPFGWTSGGAPWMVHEWLTEVFFYLALTRLGEWSLVLYKAGLAVLALGLVGLRAWKRSGSLPLSLGVVLLAALVVRNYADLRPQMLTFVLLAGLLLALDEYREGRLPRLPWLLPLVFLLWANLHGGVVVGLALAAIWVAGEALGRRFYAAGGPSVGPPALGVLAAAVAVCANPNGWHVYRYPFEVLGHPEVRGYITEWWSPNFHHSLLRAFEVMLLLTPAAYAARALAPAGEKARPVSLGELGVLLAMGHAALIAQRNTAPFALAAAPLIAEGAALAWQSANLGSLRGWLGAPGLRRAGAVLTALTACFAAWAAQPREDNSRPWWARRPIPPDRWYAYGTAQEFFPQEAVALMQEGEWPGRLYNDYVWGGYLIWELYPKRKVFVDGRAEVYYPSRAFDDEMLIHQVRDGWDRALDRREVRVILTARGGGLAAALRRHPAWELAFTGPVEVVYLRRREGLTAPARPGVP